MTRNLAFYTVIYIDKVLGYISATTVTKKQLTLRPEDHAIRPPTENLSVSGVNPYSYPKPYYRFDCSLPPYNDTVPGRRNPWSITGNKIIQFQPQGALRARMDKAWTSGDSLFFDIGVDFFGNILYEYAPKICVDCRLKGGTNIRPAYYPRN